MNSSENTHSEENNAFYYPEGMAQQRCPSFWYQNYTCNPSSVPGAGFGNEIRYFPRSVVPMEHPGFRVPQSPLPSRPVFLKCYNPAQFWHYSGYRVKMTTKETQTELQQVQHDAVSQSSWDSWDVLDNPQGEDCVSYEDEQRAVQSEQCHAEMLESGLTMEVNLGKEKGYVAVPQIPPSPGEVKDRDEIQNTLSSELYLSSVGVNKLQEPVPLSASTEAVKDLGIQSESQKPLSTGERKPDNSRGSHSLPEKVGGRDSHPQGPVPSAAWVAQLNKVDEAIQCDRSWCQDAELESSPESSPKASGKATWEKSVQCTELDEEEVGDHSNPSRATPSAAWVAQLNKIDAAIQCDGTCWQDAELESSLESSPEGSSKGTGEKSGFGDLDEDENKVGENSHPQGSTPSAAWVAQLNKVDEAIQCDGTCWQDAELEWSPEHELVNEESSPDCITHGLRKKSRNRKLSTGDQALSVFLNRKTVYLKKNAVLNIVIPDDSDDCELEDEEFEVEWLFEEDTELSTAKEKLYHEACRATRVSEGPLYPKLVWPSSYQNYYSEYAEYENIPLMFWISRPEGHHVIYSKLRTKPMANDEEESQESLT